MMKISLNQLIVLFFLLSASTFIACEKAESEESFGFNIVYIPQSVVSSGDLQYSVPALPLELSAGPRLNYVVDNENNKVNVLLGVSTSGKDATQAYSVDVTSKPDTINQLIAAGSTFVLLPATAYSLPQKVSVTGGNNSENFNLSIDKTILKTYAGKKVAVCVVISNLTNTAYTLSAKNHQVIVVIDVNALKLT